MVEERGGQNDWDSDIAARDLTAVEKNGLQVYRNYQRSFRREAISKFRAGLDTHAVDLADLERVIKLVVDEDERSLPLIACAFADDVLRASLMDAVPDQVPGGKKELFNGFGPLATLSARLKLAAAFDLFSTDLMASLNELRRLRNDVAHSWKVDELSNIWTSKGARALFPIQQLLAELKHGYEGPFGGEAVFRFQLIWMLGRLKYEGLGYWRAKAAQINPVSALYFGKDKTKLLSNIASLCIAGSDKIVRKYPFDNPMADSV